MPPPPEGFTLAEVLITLGIIGVVAAMTMPVLIEKHREKVTVNKMKKMYSTLSNAYNMYNNEEQPGEYSLPWSYDGALQVFNIFRPYLKIAKDCGANGQGCFYMKNYKWLDGSSVSANYGTDSRYYKVLLADGASIAFRGIAGNYVKDGPQFYIFYDVNGANGPNTYGKDLFQFNLVNNMVIAIGNEDSEFLTRCLGGSQNYGDRCTAWVIFNENLDYLHCKDLSWNGKTSCK